MILPEHTPLLMVFKICPGVNLLGGLAEPLMALVMESIDEPFSSAADRDAMASAIICSQRNGIANGAFGSARAWSGLLEQIRTTSSGREHCEPAAFGRERLEYHLHENR